MALGQFTDINLTSSAALSGGAWSADLPLTNLKDDRRFVSQPARQLQPANLTASQLAVTLAYPKAVTLIGVLFHTLGIDAQYRLTVASAGRTLSNPDYIGPWTPVNGRLFNSSSLDWEAPNWWTGQAVAEDLALYPRHLWIPLDPVRIVSAYRLEFDDRAAGGAFFDIGGLWTASGWSPQYNYERGHELALDARELVDEAPSGRRFAEERMPRRRLTVSWSMLTDDERFRLFDAGMRARTTRPVLFVPDLDDPISLSREAFPATFAAPPAPRRMHRSQVTAAFEEIIA